MVVSVTPVRSIGPGRTSRGGAGAGAGAGRVGDGDPGDGGPLRGPAPEAFGNGWGSGLEEAGPPRPPAPLERRARAPGGAAAGARLRPPARLRPRLGCPAGLRAKPTSRANATAASTRRTVVGWTSLQNPARSIGANYRPMAPPDTAGSVLDKICAHERSLFLTLCCPTLSG